MVRKAGSLYCRRWSRVSPTERNISSLVTLPRRRRERRAGRLGGSTLKGGRGREKGRESERESAHARERQSEGERARGRRERFEQGCWKEGARKSERGKERGGRERGKACAAPTTAPRRRPAAGEVGKSSFL
eukprot:scaffold11567_cov31-Tisochrysis_lutea.AAC.6